VHQALVVATFTSMLMAVITSTPIMHALHPKFVILNHDIRKKLAKADV